MENSRGFELHVKVIAIDGRSIQKIYTIQLSDQKSTTTRFTLLSEANDNSLPTILSNNDNENTENIEKFHLTQNKHDISTTTKSSDFMEPLRFMLSTESFAESNPLQFEKQEYQFLVENPQKNDLIGTLRLINDIEKPVHMSIEPADYAIWFHIDPRVFSFYLLKVFF